MKRVARPVLSVAAGAVVLAALMSLPAASASQNVDLMARWTAATIVNYKVIAEFSGEAFLFSAGGLNGRGMVTDRFEVEFDWNQAEYALVGKPIIRNFPSKLGALTPNGTCAITVSGPFEHATILELRNDDALRFANGVHGETQRELPGGTLPRPNEVGPCAAVHTAAPRSVRQRIVVPAPQGMMLAMPSGQAGFQHNGKSFVIKAASTEEKGWTFTVTPTIVK